MARIEESNPEDERRDESKPDLEESVTSQRNGRDIADILTATPRE